MSGFTKLFSTITTSSVWVASDKTLRVWVAMLAQANAEGMVEGSVPGFANLCLMDVPTFQAAIKPLLEPDEFSRSAENEGRRLQQVAGGWRILNYLKYRERGQGKDGSRAPYFREYRQRRRQTEEARAKYGR